MGNKRKVISVLIFAVLFVSVIAGTIFYYNGVVDGNNSKIGLLNKEITDSETQISNLTAQITNLTLEKTNLNSQISNLNAQITNQNNEIANLSSQIHVLDQANLTSPYLVTALGITEIAGNSSATRHGIISYNRLWISGSVNNTGEGTAYNAGLHFVAYAANGTLEVNMTVPLNNNDVVNYGTDAATDDSAYVGNGDNNPSFFLVSLGGGGTAVIGINIFHEGTVSNWTVTPVWTNFP